MQHELIVNLCICKAETRLPDILDSEERRRAHRIPDGKQRRKFETTRAFVRISLSRHLNCDPQELHFQNTPHGKPQLIGRSGIEFSISHSGIWIAVAIAPVPVGLDIESHRPRLDPRTLARRFFHPADAALLDSLPEANVADFFRAQWIAKEAALKLAGEGIADGLHRLHCTFSGPCVTTVIAPSSTYAISNFSLIDGTPGAVATQTADPAKLVVEPSPI